MQPFTTISAAHVAHSAFFTVILLFNIVHEYLRICYAVKPPVCVNRQETKPIVTQANSMWIKHLNCVAFSHARELVYRIAFLPMFNDCETSKCRKIRGYCKTCNWCKVRGSTLIVTTVRSAVNESLHQRCGNTTTTTALVETIQFFASYN